MEHDTLTRVVALLAALVYAVPFGLQIRRDPERWRTYAGRWGAAVGLTAVLVGIQWPTWLIGK